MPQDTEEEGLQCYPGEATRWSTMPAIQIQHEVITAKKNCVFHIRKLKPIPFIKTRSVPLSLSLSHTHTHFQRLHSRTVAKKIKCQCFRVLLISVWSPRLWIQAAHSEWVCGASSTTLHKMIEAWAVVQTGLAVVLWRIHDKKQYCRIILFTQSDAFLRTRARKI